MSAGWAAARLVRRLERTAMQAELRGRRYGEFIHNGHPADSDVVAALRAAIAFGEAIGLRQAAHLLRDLAEGADAA